MKKNNNNKATTGLLYVVKRQGIKTQIQ